YRSLHRSSECFPATMEQDESLAESAMDSHSQNSSKSHTRQSHNDTGDTFLEISGFSAIVPSAAKMPDFPPILLTLKDIFFQTDIQHPTSIRNPKWQILACNISRLGIKRKVFQRRLLTFSYQQWIRTLTERYHHLSGLGFLGVKDTLPIL